MLYDKQFLLELDNYKHKVVYARITALTFQENPIEYIEGRVTQGSINIDGDSAVRRTCSLSIAAPDFNYNNFYWGLNNKFKLEIGIENHINKDYPDIIWFKQGIYLITSFNTTRNASSFNISIQGKDKMCLLNGDVSGSLESTVDFGQIEEEDVDGNWTIRKVMIADIIKNMIHSYAGEPYYNIIINDLETQGLELLEYRYDTDLYLYRAFDSYEYENAILGNGNIKCEIYDGNTKDPINDYKGKMFSLDQIPLECLDSLVDDLLIGNQDYVFKIYKNDDENPLEGFFKIAKITYGQTAGYRLTDLTFAGDLIAKEGESLTSVLDKIKNMLVEFEYFYNLDGQFVFQKKRSLKEAIWQFNEEDKSYTPADYSYEFHGTNLISALNNNPNLLNLKNDYSIWGEREGVSGAKIPIHLRYAIDTKPVEYNSIFVDYGELDLDKEGNIQYDDKGNKKFKFKGIDADKVEAYNKKYSTFIKGQESKKYLANDKDSDWRELIYQMALDYYKYNFLDDFELKVAAANPDLYPTGRTGYEQYYRDIQGFWRDLYNPDLGAKIEKVNNDIGILNGKINSYKNAIKNYYTPLSPGTGSIDSTDVIGKLESKNKFAELNNNLEKAEEKLVELDKEKQELEKMNNQYYTKDGDFPYWNIMVYTQPELLNFWFDFLDSRGDLQQFNVKTIGNRSKVINDKNIKSIYFRDTPSIIFTSPNQDISNVAETGYRYFQLPIGLDNMFSISAQGLSAKNKLDELLYQHGYCVESATITTIPIYHLEPNTRIYLSDPNTGLDGDYIVSKISIPLTYNGTMSITATKAAENNII